MQKEGQNGVIDFSNLSSGERQIAYTISNFMYHLVNVDSEWNDFYRDSAHLQVIKYRYVNVVFDEVELYFHPELQRSFMGLLLQALKMLNSKIYVVLILYLRLTLRSFLVIFLILTYCALGKFACG